MTLQFAANSRYNDYPYVEREAILTIDLGLNNKNILSNGEYNIDVGSLKHMFNVPPNTEFSRSSDNRYIMKIRYRELAADEKITSLDLEYPSLAQSILDQREALRVI